MTLADLQAPAWLLPAAKLLWASIPQRTRDAIVAAALRELRADSGWILGELLAYVRRRISEGASADVFGDLTRFPQWSIPNDTPGNQPGPPPGEPGP